MWIQPPFSNTGISECNHSDSPPKSPPANRHSVTQASASATTAITPGGDMWVIPPFSNTGISECNLWSHGYLAASSPPPFSNTGISECNKSNAALDYGALVPPFSNTGISECNPGWVRELFGVAPPFSNTGISECNFQQMPPRSGPLNPPFSNTGISECNGEQHCRLTHNAQRIQLRARYQTAQH